MNWGRCTTGTVCHLLHPTGFNITYTPLPFPPLPILFPALSFPPQPYSSSLYALPLHPTPPISSPSPPISSPSSLLYLHSIPSTPHISSSCDSPTPLFTSLTPLPQPPSSSISHLSLPSYPTRPQPLHIPLSACLPLWDSRHTAGRYTSSPPPRWTRPLAHPPPPPWETLLAPTMTTTSMTMTMSKGWSWFPPCGGSGRPGSCGGCSGRSWGVPGRWPCRWAGDRDRGGALPW